MADIYCVASAKGGVGKTMTTFALAAAAVKAGAQTMILDLDSSRTISYQMGVPAAAAGISELLDGESSPADLWVEVSAGLHLVNGSESMDQRRLHPEDLERICGGARGIDVIVIDTAPQPIALPAPMAVADHVVIPTPPDTVAVPGAARTAEIALEEGIGDRVAGVLLTQVRRPLTLMGRIVRGAIQDCGVGLPVEVYWTTRWAAALSSGGLEGFGDLGVIAQDLLECASKQRAGEKALERFVSEWKDLGG